MPLSLDMQMNSEVVNVCQRNFAKLGKFRNNEDIEIGAGNDNDNNNSGIHIVNHGCQIRPFRRSQRDFKF